MAESGDSLVRLCFLYLGDYQLAEDAVQDSFLKAARQLHRFRGDSSKKTWLTRIAINTCKDRLRTPWHTRVEGEAALAAVPAPEPEFAADDTVIQAVFGLPDKYKEVILLRYYQELTLKEMASTLRLPLPTVSSRLRRAREALQTQLKGWYFNED